LEVVNNILHDYPKVCDSIKKAAKAKMLKT